MATTKTKTERTEFYNTVETITLELTKLQVKYIKPDIVQVKAFVMFLVNGLSKLKLTPNEINSSTYFQLRDKANNAFNDLSSEEITTLMNELIILEVNSLLEIISDCFPEVDKPRLLKENVLLDMVRVLWYAVFPEK